MTPTYEILEAGAAIRCHACGRVSHHPRDVKQRYCGHCHRFHDRQAPMLIWTLYDHPQDYPGCFVARAYGMMTGLPLADEPAITAATVEELRTKVQARSPHVLERIERDPEDDDHIIESWL